MWEPFARWVSKAYPEDAAVMYEDGGTSGVRLTKESIRLWSGTRGDTWGKWGGTPSLPARTAGSKRERRGSIPRSKPHRDPRMRSRVPSTTQPPSRSARAESLRRRRSVLSGRAA
jgi:hypothetical protein